MFEPGFRRFAVSSGAILMLAASSMAAAPVLASGPVPASGHTLPANTRFYVPPPPTGSVAQIVDLLKHRDVKDAFLIGDMITTPQAVWLNGGTPAQVQKSVKKTVDMAAAFKTVPVFVAYNIPFRDCSQFSAGGAADATAYAAWIDGIARGIGTRQAVILLEPDGLGIIPFYQPLYGNMEWCQPKDSSNNPLPGADPADRFAEMNSAVDRLEQQPNVNVYLDGTHAAWLGAGEAADRLLKAGVQKAQGFFLNVSNFQTTANSSTFGTWVSDCISAVTAPPASTPWQLGHTDWCPSQYVGSVPDYGTANVNAVNASYATMLGGASPTTHFVIDTSRNGQGPWLPPSPYTAAQAQDWCNPPNRGLGLTPTANTGNALVAAYLWVKTPGQSDGACNRWNPSGGIDPVRNMMDPAAGAWFPQLALELAKNAKPPLWLPKGVK